MCFFKNYAVLIVVNTAVAAINKALLNCFKGSIKVYKLGNFANILEEDCIERLTLEFLCTFNPPRLLPAVLRLKVSVPIILLRNINP